MNLHHYDTYLFDLDGTIYLGDEVLPGAPETIKALRASGKVVRFLSNNPTKTPEQYAEKLATMGVPSAPTDVICTLTTTVWWLRTYHPDAVVYPIAAEPLCQALREGGFQISEDPSRIDVVISSYDRGLTHAKLQIAFEALWYHKRAILIETNPDPYCPFPGGRGEVDTAAVTAALQASAQVDCVASMGKPSPWMFQAALADSRVPPQRVLMVGDRLATDVQMAFNCGIDAVVVLTGQTRREDLTGMYSQITSVENLQELL